MPIRVECPKCGRVTPFADNDAGLAMACLGCRHVMVVPRPEPKAKVAGPQVPSGGTAAGEPLLFGGSTAVRAPEPASATAPAGQAAVEGTSGSGLGSVAGRSPAQPTRQRTGAKPVPENGRGRLAKAGGHESGAAAAPAAPRPARSPSRFRRRVLKAVPALVALGLFGAGVAWIVWKNFVGPRAAGGGDPAKALAQTGPSTSPTSAPIGRGGGTTPGSTAAASPVAPASNPGGSGATATPTPVASARPPVGFIGLESIELHDGVLVDAYDSSAGPYDPAKATDVAPVMSNGRITIAGDGRVRGNVAPGPTAEIKLSKKARVEGKVDRLEAPLAAPPVDVNAGGGLREHSNSAIPDAFLVDGSLVINRGKTVALPAGFYDIQDLMIDGRSTLRFDGPATVLVRGRVTIMGGVETHENKPANLKLRVASGRPVVIAQKNALYVDLYAPESSVNVSGAGEVFGALVARGLSVSGKRRLHFDTALAPK